MSLFSKFKRAMGFGPDAEIDDPLFADTASESPADASNGRNIPVQQQPLNGLPEFDPAVRDLIFDKILEVFNQALPEFLKNSVDREAQRSYLRGCLDEGINEYMDSLNKTVEEYCETLIKRRQEDMASELDAIKRRADDVERQSSDLQQKQLSADRQKRALTEKVHELESQVARLASEREQFELENRSLMNRLKASNVMHEDVEKANQEVQALRGELKRLREDPEAIGREREEAHKAQVDKMQDGIDSLKEQLRVAGEMHDDMKRRLADADTKIAEQANEISGLNELVAQFEEASQKMEKIESAMAAYENKISAQKKELTQKDAEITRLKETIAENSKRQAEREQLLRKEIEELRPAMVMGSAAIDFDDTVDDAPKISEEYLSGLDESFDAIEQKDNSKAGNADRPAVNADDKPRRESVADRNAAPRKDKQKNKPDQLSLF